MKSTLRAILPRGVRLMLLSYILIYPRLKARQLLLQFSRAIAMDRRLSDAPSGTAQRDLLNWSNSWMKSIAFERLLFVYFFLAVEEKVTGLKAAAARSSSQNPAGRGARQCIKPATQTLRI
jgi:hypothetical protein